MAYQGNGVRQKTLRTNITQPYKVGFLADKDHPDYHASVYDQLQDVQTATEHMFKGLDDVNKEIENRTHALQALNLQTDATFQKVWAEVGNVKLELGKNITIDNITDLNGNTLNGVLEGIKQTVNTANGQITVVQGEITNTNQRVDGVITQINTIDGTNQANISTINAAITRIDATGGHTMEAQWGVKQNVNGLVSGVGLVNNGGKSVFTVQADQFRVVTSTAGVGTSDTPFTIDSGVVKIDAARIKNLTVTNAQIRGTLSSQSNTGGKGWSLTQDGKLSASGVDISGNITATSGTFTGQVNASSGTFNGTVNANAGNFHNVHIFGDCVVDANIDVGHINGDLFQGASWSLHMQKNHQDGRVVFKGNPRFAMSLYVSFTAQQDTTSNATLTWWRDGEPAQAHGGMVGNMRADVGAGQQIGFNWHQVNGDDHKGIIVNITMMAFPQGRSGWTGSGGIEGGF